MKTRQPPDKYVITAYLGEDGPRIPNSDYVIQRQSYQWWGPGNRWMSNVQDRMVGARRYKKSQIEEALAERDRLNAESGAKL